MHWLTQWKWLHRSWFSIFIILIIKSSDAYDMKKISPDVVTFNALIDAITGFKTEFCHLFNNPWRISDFDWFCFESYNNPNCKWEEREGLSISREREEAALDGRKRNPNWSLESKNGPSSARNDFWFGFVSILRFHFVFGFKFVCFGK